MPAPLAIGALSLAAASKQAALQAAASVSSYDVGVASTAISCYALARVAWQRVPDWIKQDVSVRNLLGSRRRKMKQQQQSGTEKDEPGNTDDYDDYVDELANLPSVIEKLQLLVQSGAERFEKFHFEPVQHLQVALLLYIQLSSQLRRLHPDRRNDWYKSSGSSVRDMSCFDVDVTELRNSFDWSILAYEADLGRLKQSLLEDFEVLQHNPMPSCPGYVGHFVAVSHQKRLVVIGIKGTSTLEDLLTDCCGRAVPYKQNFSDEQVVEVSAEEPDSIDASDLEIEVTSGHERIWVHANDDDRIRCHEGILLSAQRLADVVEGVVEEMIVQRQYRCVLCGHSLGAGAAALLALVLRTRFPVLAQDRRSLRVYAFAPPPVLDHDSAMVASSYMLSIVNNADIIPRSSLANLVVFLEFLRSVSQRLVEKGLAPTQPASVAALISKLAKGADDEDLLMTMEEVEHARDTAYQKVHLNDPDHLYIPGPVLVLFEHWEDMPSNNNNSGSLFRTEADSGVRGALYTDGSSDILRFFEFDGFKLFSDHISASYASSLETLCFR